MCITAFFLRNIGRWRFVFIGNRDEFPRGTQDICFTDEGILCAVDETAGGTQCGFNPKTGIVANLTNVRKQAVREGARSRGMVVSDALHGRPFDMTEKDEYAGFNLLSYNVKAGVAEYRTNCHQWDGPDVTVIHEGAHCMSNSYLNDSSWPKVTRLRTNLADLLDQTSDADHAHSLMENLASLLCDTFSTDEYPADLNDPKENLYAAVEKELQSGIWVKASCPDGRVFRTRYQTVILVEQPEAEESGVDLPPMLLHYWYRPTESPTEHGEWRKFSVEIAHDKVPQQAEKSEEAHDKVPQKAEESEEDHDKVPQQTEKSEEARDMVPQQAEKSEEARC